jgi:MFS family permease
MAEITDATNAGIAFSYMPIAWSIGATLGPMIGGMLANPYKRFGDGGRNAYWSSEWWRAHPYFLACAVPASFSLMMVLLNWMLLKEVSDISTLSVMD